MNYDTDLAKKLADALYAMFRENLTGRAGAAFDACQNLRVGIDLVEGRLGPYDDDALRITGIEEFYRDSIQQARRVLGMPAN